MNTLPRRPDSKPDHSLSESGAAMRDQAVAALGTRYRLLSERAKHRLLTDAERSELARLEVVLDTLQGMAADTDA